jgi:hypothetical protein
MNIYGYLADSMEGCTDWQVDQSISGAYHNFNKDYFNNDRF